MSVYLRFRQIVIRMGLRNASFACHPTMFAIPSANVSSERKVRVNLESMHFAGMAGTRQKQHPEVPTIFLHLCMSKLSTRIGVCELLRFLADTHPSHQWQGLGCECAQKRGIMHFLNISALLASRSVQCRASRQW